VPRVAGVDKPFCDGTRARSDFNIRQGDSDQGARADPQWQRGAHLARGRRRRSAPGRIL